MGCIWYVQPTYSTYAEEKMMKAITKAQLHEALRAAGVMFRTKAPKAELEKLFADNQQAVNGHATPKNKAKKPLGSKAALRHKFEQRGYITSKQIDQIAATLNVTRATVLTAMSDLKNPKYAGSLGALDVQKDGDDYRLAK